MKNACTIRVSGTDLLPKEARKPKLIEEACRLSLRSKPAKKGSKPKGEINIVFLAGPRMRSLNKRFLKRDRDTDVLSFSYDAPAPGAPAADQPFGDIFISTSKIRSQAKDLGHSALKETLTLVSHGSLHLLNYDDATRSQKALMTKLQDKVLAKLKPLRSTTAACRSAASIKEAIIEDQGDARWQF
ncbi:MAG: rRNA maturation RNase YbeY [Elusimicrobia bacterium]|nr:rRNA maturation RNase YbeY [Elusimicrobiota bacterium]